MRRQPISSEFRSLRKAESLKAIGRQQPGFSLPEFMALASLNGALRPYRRSVRFALAIVVPNWEERETYVRVAKARGAAFLRNTLFQAEPNPAIITSWIKGSSYAPSVIHSSRSATPKWQFNGCEDCHFAGIATNTKWQFRSKECGFVNEAG